MEIDLDDDSFHLNDAAKQRETDQENLRKMLKKAAMWESLWKDVPQPPNMKVTAPLADAIASHQFAAWFNCTRFNGVTHAYKIVFGNNQKADYKKAVTDLQKDRFEYGEWKDKKKKANGMNGFDAEAEASFRRGNPLNKRQQQYLDNVKMYKRRFTDSIKDQERDEVNNPDAWRKFSTPRLKKEKNNVSGMYENGSPSKHSYIQDTFGFSVKDSEKEPSEEFVIQPLSIVSSPIKRRRLSPKSGKSEQAKQSTDTNSDLDYSDSNEAAMIQRKRSAMAMLSNMGTQES